MHSDEEMKLIFPTPHKAHSGAPGFTEFLPAAPSEARLCAFLNEGRAKQVKRAKRIEWVSLVVDGCSLFVCSHFAHFIASMLVLQKARSQYFARSPGQLSQSPMLSWSLTVGLLASTSTLNFPGAQSSHSLNPVSPANVPWSHTTHVVRPVTPA